jgi:hypothetical protein
MVGVTARRGRWSLLRSWVGGWWIPVVALVVVSTGLRAWAALAVSVPWIAPDEMIYGLLGRSLYHSGELAILGGPTPFYSALVPTFVGLPLSLSDLELGYGLLKLLQALVMSLTAVPVYLWSRSFVGQRYALVAAALTVAVPALVYSGLVMTEVFFYPILVLAGWSMARVLEHASLRRQAWLVVAVVAAVATRLQAIVLLPAFATALGLDAALGRSTQNLRRLRPALMAFSMALVAWLIWRLVGGEPVLGGYGVVTHVSYSVGRAVRFVVYHAGSLVILTGILPVCALLLLMFAAFRRLETEPRVRAFLAVTCSLTVWFVVEVGVFASRYVGQLAERDLIALAPFLFIAFALWLERGGQRGYWPMSIAGVLTAAPLAVLPLGQLVTAYAPPDAPSLIPFYELRKATSLLVLELVFFAIAAAAIVTFALIPRKALLVLPLVLLAALAASSVAASRYAADQALLRQQTFLGRDIRWIDHSALGPVAYLYQRGDDWVGAWETVFWNRRIDTVFDLPGAHLFGPMPQQQLSVRADGVVLAGTHTIRPRYVVASTGAVTSEPAIAFHGQQIATSFQQGGTQGGLALWRIKPPLRLSFQTSGLKPNGDIHAGGNGRIVAYGCPQAVFQLTLLVKQPQTITISRNGTPYRTLTFPVATTWRGAIPTLPPPGQARSQSACTLNVQPSGLLGTTVFEVQ